MNMRKAATPATVLIWGNCYLVSQRIQIEGKREELSMLFIGILPTFFPQIYHGKVECANDM